MDNNISALAQVQECSPMPMPLILQRTETYRRLPPYPPSSEGNLETKNYYLVDTSMWDVVHHNQFLQQVLPAPPPYPGLNHNHGHLNHNNGHQNNSHGHLNQNHGYPNNSHGNLNYNNGHLNNNHGHLNQNNDHLNNNHGHLNQNNGHHNNNHGYSNLNHTNGYHTNNLGHLNHTSNGHHTNPGHPNLIPPRPYEVNRGTFDASGYIPSPMPTVSPANEFLCAPQSLYRPMPAPRPHALPYSSLLPSNTTPTSIAHNTLKKTVCPLPRKRKLTGTHSPSPIPRKRSTTGCQQSSRIHPVRLSQVFTPNGPLISRPVINELCPSVEKLSSRFVPRIITAKRRKNWEDECIREFESEAVLRSQFPGIEYYLFDHAEVMEAIAEAQGRFINIKK